MWMFHEQHRSAMDPTFSQGETATTVDYFFSNVASFARLSL